MLCPACIPGFFDEMWFTVFFFVFFQVAMHDMPEIYEKSLLTFLKMQRG
jgi:hypothetical protein